MNFNQKVQDLLSLALEQYPNIFLVDLKISNDKSINVILDGDKEVNQNDVILKCPQKGWQDPPENREYGVEHNSVDGREDEVVA